MAELKARGVKFDQEVADAGYGLVTYFTMPGDVRVQLPASLPEEVDAEAKDSSEASPEVQDPTRISEEEVGGRKHR